MSVLVGLAALGAPAGARANGVQAHMYIAELATAELPDGELRSIVTDPELLTVLRTGAFYPDSGYAIDDAYGEWSHWEPFLEADMDVLRARWRGDYSSPEARRDVAFLMGVAA